MVLTEWTDHSDFNVAQLWQWPAIVRHGAPTTGKSMNKSKGELQIIIVYVDILCIRNSVS